MINHMGHSENAYTTIAQISDKSGVSQEKVQDCLEGDLSQFICFLFVNMLFFAESPLDKSRLRMKLLFINGGSEKNGNIAALTAELNLKFSSAVSKV